MICKNRWLKLTSINLSMLMIKIGHNSERPYCYHRLYMNNWQNLNNFSIGKNESIIAI